MDGGRNNYSGSGRGRGGGRRGGGRGSGDGQNQGGGRGWNAPSNRGSQPHWVSRPTAPANQPPPQPIWGVRPPQATVPQQPQPLGVVPSSGRPWGPSSSTAPVQPPSPSPEPGKPPPSVELGVQSLKISEKLSSSSPQSKEAGQIQAIKRPDHGTLAVRKVNIIVNHFPVTFAKQGTIYHYDVDVRPVSSDGNPPQMRKPLRKSDKRFIRDLAFPNDLLKSAFDGEKNIFSAVPLKELKDKVDVPEGEDVRSGSYMLTIKLVNELKLSKLYDYLRGSLPAVPRDTLQVLDQVMKENPM